MEKERLIELIDKGLSIREIADIYSAGFSTVRYWLKKHELQTKTYNHQNSFCKFCNKELNGRQTDYCNNKCQNQFQTARLIEKWKRKEITGHTGKTLLVRNFVRKHLIEKAGYKCSKCEWNKPHPVTKIPPLEINHIDGNAENTWEENLEVLCPNCHSLTSTYKNRNKGKGKRAR